jgi:CxxC motif-containing protein (DUF1111 family)
MVLYGYPQTQQGQKMAIRKKISKKVPGRGRPATGRERQVQMILRLSEAERAAIEAAAAAAGQSPGLWARTLLLQAAASHWAAEG